MPGDFTDSRIDPADPQERGATVPPRTLHRPQHRENNANFMLTGFHQANGIRSTLYLCRHHDGSTSEFTVEADLLLLRKHGIALQELPLLCRTLLEKQNPGSAPATITFTEALMKEQADQRAALKQAAEARKKPYRRVVRPTHLGLDRR